MLLGRSCCNELHRTVDFLCTVQCKRLQCTVRVRTRTGTRLNKPFTASTIHCTRTGPCSTGCCPRCPRTIALRTLPNLATLGRSGGWVPFGRSPEDGDPIEKRVRRVSPWALHSRLPCASKDQAQMTAQPPGLRCTACPHGCTGKLVSNPQGMHRTFRSRDRASVASLPAYDASQSGLQRTVGCRSCRRGRAENGPFDQSGRAETDFVQSERDGFFLYGTSLDLTCTRCSTCRWHGMPLRAASSSRRLCLMRSTPQLRLKQSFALEIFANGGGGEDDGALWRFLPFFLTFFFSFNGCRLPVDDCNCFQHIQSSSACTPSLRNRDATHEPTQPFSMA